MESHKILSDFFLEIRKRHDAIPASIFGGPKPAHRQLAAVGEALVELGALLEAHATNVFNGTAHDQNTEGTPPTPAEYLQDAMENDGILYGPGAGRPLGLVAQSTNKRDRQRLQSAFKKGVKEGRRIEREAHRVHSSTIADQIEEKGKP